MFDVLPSTSFNSFGPRSADDRSARTTPAALRGSGPPIIKHSHSPHVASPY